MLSKNLVSMAVLFLVACVGSPALAQTTAIKTEYLMTYVAQLDPPYPIDNSLVIVNVKPGRK